MTTDVKVDSALTKLVDSLRAAVGEDLVSVVLYGSAARGDYEKATSDLNVLIVMERLTPQALERVSAPVKKWERSGQPPPRLLSRPIISESADVFPIEFLDLKAAHRILYGEALFADLDIPLDHLRTQCERELREKMMRLREAYLEVHDSPRKLNRLLTDSYSTFVALFRGCLHLHGDEVPAHNDEVAAAFAAAADLDRAPLDEVALLKHGQTAGGNPKELFARYYDELTKAVARIDRFAPSPGGTYE